GVAAQGWVSMGDPVGPREEWPELIWRFRELGDRHGGRVAFYEIAAADLPLYLDLGLTLLKLGEAARVPLDRFSLEGRARKELRHTFRKLANEGCRFEIIPAQGVPALLAELQVVSDAWLKQKHVGEKGFSLGRFDPDYLRRFPLAVVWNDDRIMAFANVWP